MTKILALSGKKQSGKNTSANFLIGSAMLSLNMVDYAYVDEKGRLIMPFAKADGTTEPCIFPADSTHPNITSFLAKHVWPTVKLYSFADLLKQTCINVLGLETHQCYGTDDDKNTKTSLLWENMPGVTIEKTPQDVVDKEVAGRLGKYYEKILGGMVYHPPGPMTAREVLQFVGTEIFRKMSYNVWVDATIRKIQADNPKLAIVTDCRFPNEVEGIQNAGGKVIRFTRGPFAGQDEHASETALDEANFDWSKFDAVIDNKDMDIDTQNEHVFNLLREWGIVDYERLANENPQAA